MDNNLEKNIKQQLEERRIEPSASVWEQLEPKIVEKQGVAFPYKWLSIAATIVFLTSITLWFTYNKEETKQEFVQEQIVPQKEVAEPQITDENMLRQAQHNIKVVYYENKTREQNINKVQKKEYSSPKDIKVTKLKLTTDQQVQFKVKTVENNNSKKPINLQVAKQDIKINDQQKIKNSIEETYPKIPEEKMLIVENQAIKKNRKSYVNKDMLIFSVENQEVIASYEETTKDKILTFIDQKIIKNN